MSEAEDYNPFRLTKEEIASLDPNYKKPKKRKTEVEKLRIEHWNPPSGKRSRNQNSLSSINNSNPTGKLGVSPSPNLLPNTTNIGYAVYEDTEEKQLETEGRDHGVVAGLADWETLLSNTNY